MGLKNVDIQKHYFNVNLVNYKCYTECKEMALHRHEYSRDYSGPGEALHV